VGYKTVASISPPFKWWAGCNNTGAAEKARDYLMALPDRFKRISERGLKAPVEYQFSWIRY
jgi:hypothetical protein